MDESQKKSIEQLLAMDKEKLLGYLDNLLPEERKRVNLEMFKAQADKTTQALVDNLNRNLQNQREE